MTGIVQQTQIYRRGLILGLTIAESVVLIIFALLLILATLLLKKEKELEALQGQYKALEDKVAAFSEMADKFGNIDNFMDELLRLRNRAKQADELSQRIATLEAELNQQRQRIETGKNQLAELEELQKLLKNVNQQIATDQPISEKLAILIERAAAWERLTQQIAQNESMTIEEVEQQVVKHIGRGTERPACWVSADGKPEYIFDIELHPDGVIVHDNELPHRVEAQRQLPLDSFVFRRKISFGQFRIAADRLQEWAKQGQAGQKSCVFFVRVIDRTPPNQKAVYKNRLRIVGEYFYYYEPP